MAVEPKFTTKFKAGDVIAYKHGYNNERFLITKIEDFTYYNCNIHNKEKEIPNSIEWIEDNMELCEGFLAKERFAKDLEELLK